MAIANTKGVHITNADTAPGVLTDAVISRGDLLEAADTVETAAADDAASVYRLVRVSSNARLSSILLAADPIAGATSCAVGVYQTQSHGGGVVDADIFAAAVDLSGGLAFTEVQYLATPTDIAKAGQRLWQVLGLPADTFRNYDISVTVNDVTAAGTIAMKVKFVI